MSWNLLPRRGTRPDASASSHSAPAGDAAISPSARGQLLAVFRRLAAVLQLTAATATTLGKAESHAELVARLAIFRARVEAGEASPRLAASLAEFGKEFKAFVLVELGFRRV